MAEKVLEKIELVIAHDLTQPDNGLKGSVSALCYSPDLDARFAVGVPLAGVEEIIGNAKKALIAHLEDDGKHNVREFVLPETQETEE
jgi:hypothetical protein